MYQGDKKIIVLLSQRRYWDFIPFFESLANYIDIEIALLVRENIESLPNTKLSISIFIEKNSTSSVFPDLELNIEKFSAIFTVDHWSLSSFQASRLASRYNIPLFTLFINLGVNSQYTSAYSRAYEYDVQQTTACFFVFSKECKSELCMKGVSSDKIETIDFKIDNSKQGLDRSKSFKTYLGIEDDSYVVVFEDDFTEDCGADKLLKAWSYFLESFDDYRRPYLIFSGQGSSVREYQYLAVSLGLGNSLRFLNQDNFEFKFDLYRLADLYLPPFEFTRREDIVIPTRVLEAVSCGAFPVVNTEPIYKDFLPNVEPSLKNTTIKGIADALSGLATCDSRRLHSQDLFSVSISDRLLPTKIGTKIRKIVLDSFDSKPDFENALRAVYALLDRGNYDQAFIEIEDNLLKRYLSKYYKSEFYRCKGDAFRYKGLIDSSITSYRTSLEYNPGNKVVHLRLGKALFMTKTFDEAGLCFRRAISIDESCGESYLGLCMLALEAGITNDAKFYLEESFLRGVSYDATSACLIKILSLCSDENAKIEYLEILNKIDGQNKTVLQLLGELYIRAGNVDKGECFLEQSRSNSQKSADS